MTNLGRGVLYPLNILICKNSKSFPQIYSKPRPVCKADVYPMLFILSKVVKITVIFILCFNHTIASYPWIKEQLEIDAADKKLIFVKEIVIGITGKYDKLPKGFRHAFLLRHPLKVSQNHFFFVIYIYVDHVRFQ